MAGMKNKNMENIVVTGVSTGIGYATAKVLAEAGYHVWGSVRKQADADRLQAEIGERFSPLIFDVTKQDDVARAAETVGKALAGKGLAGLVNNAGIAVGGPLLHMPLDELRWQIEVNVIGLAGVTQAFAPLLGAKRGCSFSPGRIINISSVAGVLTTPFLSAYSASKHAVEALSHGFRRELMMYGVDVIIVGPGPIDTPIVHKFPSEEEGAHYGTDYQKPAEIFRKKSLERFEKGALPAEDVGRLILKIMRAKKPKTRYPILAGKFFEYTLPKMLPDRMLDKAMAKELGLERLE